MLAAVLAAACGGGEKDAEVVRRFLDRAEAGPHVYRSVETAEGSKIETTVRVDDSFRSQTTLTMDGVPLLDQIVVDDAVAIRLLAPDRWNPAAGTPLEAILASGEWVVDPAGAPPVFLPSGEQRSILSDVGADPLFDAQNAIEYARQAVDAAVDVEKFSPDSIDYRPSEDPFRDLVEADERRGIERYIAQPPLLPRTEEQLQRIPGPDAFRRLSVYAKGNELVRVHEFIDFESHPELVKAKERRQPRFLLELLQALRRGIGEEPVRPRSWTLEVVSRGDPVEIALPSPARTANLTELIGSGRFAELSRPVELTEPEPGDGSST